MNYPTEILPNKNRKLISCEIQSQYLIRSTPTSVISDLIDEVTGDIKQKTICSPEIYSYLVWQSHEFI
jgi:hypothetical protein